MKKCRGSADIQIQKDNSFHQKKTLLSKVKVVKFKNTRYQKVKKEMKDDEIWKYEER